MNNPRREAIDWDDLPRERQRRLVADAGMPALLADLVTRTSDLEG